MSDMPPTDQPPTSPGQRLDAAIAEVKQIVQDFANEVRTQLQDKAPEVQQKLQEFGQKLDQKLDELGARINSGQITRDK